MSNNKKPFVVSSPSLPRSFSLFLLGQGRALPTELLSQYVIRICYSGSGSLAGVRGSILFDFAGTKIMFCLMIAKKSR